MTEPAQHLEVVAAVAIYRDLVLLDAVVAAQPRHRLALVARLVGDLEHHRVERRVDHRVGVVGQKGLEFAVELIGRHAAIDLAHLVRKDGRKRLPKELLLVRTAAGPHAAHDDPAHEAVALKALLMHLVAAAGKHPVGRAAVEANLRKRVQQLLDKRWIDGERLEHLAVAPAHDGAVGAHRVDGQAGEPAVPDGKHRAPRRRHHVGAELDRTGDCSANRAVRLVQAVEQGSIQIAGK